MTEATTSAQEDVLRAAFVEMLFALAVSQVAIHAADLVRIEAAIENKLPAISHLVVSLILISASWVGWRQSVSPGIKDNRVRHIFSLPFVGLLLDVCLVVVYFIVVRNVEINEKDGVRFLTPSSALPEARWIAVVFCVYVVWDVITDVLSPGCIPTHLAGWRKLGVATRAAIVSTYCSGICLLSTVVVLCLANNRTSTRDVVLLDGMLLCAILFFRTIKATENFWSGVFNVKECKAFSKPREVVGTEGRWSVALAILYGVCFLLLLCRS